MLRDEVPLPKPLPANCTRRGCLSLPTTPCFLSGEDLYSLVGGRRPVCPIQRRAHRICAAHDNLASLCTHFEIRMCRRASHPTALLCRSGRRPDRTIVTSCLPASRPELASLCIAFTSLGQALVSCREGLSSNLPSSSWRVRGRTNPTKLDLASFCARHTPPCARPSHGADEGVCRPRNSTDRPTNRIARRHKMTTD